MRRRTWEGKLPAAVSDGSHHRTRPWSSRFSSPGGLVSSGQGTGGPVMRGSAGLFHVELRGALDCYPARSARAADRRLGGVHIARRRDPALRGAAVVEVSGQTARGGSVGGTGCLHPADADHDSKTEPVQPHIGG